MGYTLAVHVVDDKTLNRKKTLTHLSWKTLAILPGYISHIELYQESSGHNFEAISKVLLL